VYFWYSSSSHLHAHALREGRREEAGPQRLFGRLAHAQIGHQGEGC